MEYKVIVSKAGYNALTEVDPDNLIFSSDYNTLKYYAVGSAFISVTVSALNVEYISEVTIAHNLGYQPVFFTYVYYIGYNFMPFTRGGVTGGYYINSYVDGNNLKIKMWALHTAGSVPITYGHTIYYFLFKNNLGLYDS